MRTTYALAALLLAMLLTSAAPSANAAATLQLTDGASTVTIADTGTATCAGACSGFSAGTDSNPNPGVVTWIGSFDTWIVNVTTGATKPTLGTATDPRLDLATLNIAASAAGSLVLRFSDTGFLAPSFNFEMDGGGTANPGALAGSSYSAYYDTSDTLLAQTTLLGSMPYSGTSFSGTIPNLIGPSTTPYSLTQVVSMNFTGGGETFSGDFHLEATPGDVPEPATVGMLGGMLLVTFGAIRRKLRRA